MISRQQLLKSLYNSQRVMALQNFKRSTASRSMLASHSMGTSRPMLLFSAKRTLASTTFIDINSDINPKSNLYQNIHHAYGTAGIQWLKSLPNSVKTLAHQWKLKELSVVSSHEYSYNYVLLGKKEEGQPIVLKLGYDKPSMIAEISALKLYNGKGSVKVLDHDVEHNAILRECILPGNSLKAKVGFNDFFALPILSTLMKILHEINVSPKSLKIFPTMEDEFSSLYDKGMGERIPSFHLHKAQTLSKELIATQGKTLLLHGDLHAENVLLGNTNQWITIDPKGIIGEPAYESIPFIRDSMSGSSHSDLQTVQKRIKYFSHFFGISQQRLTDWCYAHAVLSVCRAIKSGAPGDHWGNSQRYIAYFQDESSKSYDSSKSYTTYTSSRKR